MNRRGIYLGLAVAVEAASLLIPMEAEACLLYTSGPAGATKFMVQHIQETGFEKSQMGYACAMAMVLFAVLAVLTMAQFKLNKGGSQNENE